MCVETLELSKRDSSEIFGFEVKAVELREEREDCRPFRDAV